MKADHVLQSVRTHVRLGLCLVALAGASLSHAQVPAQNAAYNAFDWMMRQPRGNTTQFGIAIDGSRIPISRPVGLTGFIPAGNYGSVLNVPSASGITINAAVDSAFVGGAANKASFNVAQGITRAALMDGMGILVGNAVRMAGGPLGIGVMLATPFMIDMMSKAGVAKNPDPATNVEKPFLADGFQDPVFLWQGGFTSPLESCKAYMGPAAVSVAAGNTPLQRSCRNSQGNDLGIVVGQYWCPANTAPVTANDPNECTKVPIPTRPANWDMARPKFEAMPVLPSNILQQQIDIARQQDGKNGIEPWKIAVGPATVSGPPSLPSTTDKTTTTGTDSQGRPTTTTTTKTTETAVSYDGDKVKVTPTTTTTTTTKTTQPDGSVTESTDTTTTQPEKESAPEKETDTDLCKLHPDILACAKPELDTPKEVIPKEDKTITYSPEEVLGTGSCPADSILTLQTNGQTLKVWDWQQACQYALPIRTIIVLLATFAAVLIVMPGETRV